MSNVLELSAIAYREGGEQYNHLPRSRYSGAPLLKGRMVVSIVATLAGQGHSHIVFEWHAKEKTDKKWKDDGSWDFEIPITEQRRHDLFHLVPFRTEQELQNQIEPDSTHLSFNQLDGVVIYKQDRPKYFPRPKVDSAYRSWSVPFERGLAARDAAYAAVYAPPKFNLIKVGGMNCSAFTIDIAKEAGIDPKPFLSSLPLPVPPKWLVKQNCIVRTEEEMWQERRDS